MKQQQTYLVQPGDTLQRISKKLGLSSIDIMAYHNRTCEAHEKIAGGQPISVEEILISPDFVIAPDEMVQSLLGRVENTNNRLAN